MKRKTYFRLLTLSIAGFMSFSTVATQLHFDTKAFSSSAENGTTEETPSGNGSSNKAGTFTRLENSDIFQNATKAAFDPSVVFELPETVEKTPDEILSSFNEISESYKQEETQDSTEPVTFDVEGFKKFWNEEYQEDTAISSVNIFLPKI